jgi:hypothetical protein
MATRSRQEVVAVVAAAVAATAASMVPLAPFPTAVDQTAVVEIPDDEAPPPGWGQWENWPAPAPEPAAGVLVIDVQRAGRSGRTGPARCGPRQATGRTGSDHTGLQAATSAHGLVRGPF